MSRPDRGEFRGEESGDGAETMFQRRDTVVIGPEVVIEPGARIWPFVILEGRTRIGKGAVIGPWCRIENSTIGDGATILDSCLIRDSVVGPGASVGPFAHLRPDSHLGEGAKVGNFVELKKASLGPGAKASHLAYVGNATVGAAANIGAGTITCNYDGASKHPTAIGAGAFVGSNATLVAPVNIGENAYVAAGSVVTRDVPAGDLAVGRSRQENKPGWAARRALKRAGRE
jgi:bifunctional UDP-N-acetylglucosamine pyrophosphorylase/glucosamine-1-phosphate N-acetyltransferase